MSRWIDAEYCEDFFDRWESEVKDAEPVTIDVVQNTRTLLRDAPSIDIVRCSECKYWNMVSNGCMRNPSVEGWQADDFCSYGERNSSEKPNNCEHITEDGVTCAKYPACDDCLDNPLNKVKGSERLVKGSEKPNNSERSKE